MFSLFQKKNKTHSEEERVETNPDQEGNPASDETVSRAEGGMKEAASFDDVMNIQTRASDRLNAITPKRLQSIGDGSLLKVRVGTRMKPETVSDALSSERGQVISEKEASAQSSENKQEENIEESRSVPFGKTSTVPLETQTTNESSESFYPPTIESDSELTEGENTESELQNSNTERDATPPDLDRKEEVSDTMSVEKKSVHQDIEEQRLDTTTTPHPGPSLPLVPSNTPVSRMEKEPPTDSVTTKKAPEPRIIMPQTSNPQTPSFSDSHETKPSDVPTPKIPFENVEHSQLSPTTTPHYAPLYGARHTPYKKQQNIGTPKTLESTGEKQTEQRTNPYENTELLKSVNESFDRQSKKQETPDELTDVRINTLENDRIDPTLPPQKQTFDSPYLEQAGVETASTSVGNVGISNTGGVLQKSNTPSFEAQGNPREVADSNIGTKENIDGIQAPPPKSPKQSWIRTYRDDLKEGIKSQGPETVTKVLRAEKRRQEIKRKYRLSSPKNIATVVSSLALFLGTIGIIFYIILISIPEPKQDLMPPPLISVNKTQTLTLDRKSPETMHGALTLAQESDMATGTILRFVPIESYTALTLQGKKMLIRYTTPVDFLKALQSSAPERFLQTLGNSGVFGIYAGKDGNHPFIILKTKFYESAFSGMTGWEKDLAREFSLWFGLRDSDAITDIKIENDIIKNNDIRILTSLSGKTLLLYSFSDQSTIVITDNKDTLLELFDRLDNTA